MSRFSVKEILFNNYILDIKTIREKNIDDILEEN